MYEAFKEMTKFIYYLDDKYSNKGIVIEGENIYVWNLIRQDVHHKLRFDLKLSEKEIKHSHKLIFLSLVREVKYRIQSRYTGKSLLIKWNRNSLLQNKYLTITDVYMSDTIFSDDIVNPNKIFSSLVKMYFIKSKISNNADLLRFIDTIGKEIYIKFNIDVDLKDITMNNLAFFIINSKMTSNYLDKCVDLEKIYFFDNYKKEYLINEARKRNIETIELQHGAFDYLHVGYSNGCNFNSIYRSERLVITDPYWSNNIKNNTTKIEIDNSNHEDFLTKNIKKIDSNFTLFISQPFINNALYNEACDLVKCNPSIEIIFKVHPRQKFKPDNISKRIRIIHDEIDIEDLIFNANEVYGGFSTSLLDAANFGKKVLIYKHLCLMECYIDDDRMVKL